MTDTWTIIVTVATGDYDQVLSKVKALIEYLDGQTNNTEVTNLIPFPELSRVKINLQNARQQVSYLKLLLTTSTHPKQGVIGSIGSVLKFFLGHGLVMIMKH